MEESKNYKIFITEDDIEDYIKENYDRLKEIVTIEDFKKNGRLKSDEKNLKRIDFFSKISC